MNFEQFQLQNPVSIIPGNEQYLKPQNSSVTQLLIYIFLTLDICMQ